MDNRKIYTRNSLKFKTVEQFCRIFGELHAGNVCYITHDRRLLDFKSLTVTKLHTHRGLIITRSKNAVSKSDAKSRSK